jgi:hypothetical protein
MDGDHVQLAIYKVSGFELFNTRQYHNYETWSDGYIIRDGEVIVTAEDLDDAIRLYRISRKELADGTLPVWRQDRDPPPTVGRYKPNPALLRADAP